MTDVLVDTVRLRGPRAHRLARVAARALPAALERAMADVPDQRVPRVAVVLDLDPEEYDDETLAVLWADLIRAELVARPPRRDRRLGERSTQDEHPPGRPGHLDRDDAVAAARAWSAAASGDAPLPAALLRLGDPGTAASVEALLGPAEWTRLVRSLAVALRLGNAPRASGDDVPEDGAVERPALAPDDRSWPAGRVPRVPAAGTGSLAGAGVPGGSSSGVPPSVPGPGGSPDDPLAVLRVLSGLRHGAAAPLDPAAITWCAGLVLLYPWLADHCRAAEELHPGLDPVPVREAALAAVLGAAHHADDPLVGLLAGRPEALERKPAIRAPLLRAHEVGESADRVLAWFTALLPGFERSTPGYVREGWLLRPGVIDRGRDPLLLTVAGQPLDVLLPLLPYPLGLLRLPWSPPLSVRFQP